MKNAGFALTELIAVMVLMGILLSMAVLSFSQWQKKNGLERQMNELYLDLMNARHQAMVTKGPYKVVFSPSSVVFTSFVDDDDLVGTVVETKALKYPISLSTWIQPSATELRFSSKGIMVDPTPKAICAYSNLSPAIDSLVIAQTRIALGRINNQGAGCDATNITLR